MYVWHFHIDILNNGIIKKYVLAVQNSHCGVKSVVAVFIFDQSAKATFIS